MILTLILGTLTVGTVGYGVLFHEASNSAPSPNSMAPVAVDDCFVKHQSITVMGVPVQPVGDMYIDCTDSVLERFEAGKPPVVVPEQSDKELLFQRSRP